MEPNIAINMSLKTYLSVSNIDSNTVHEHDMSQHLGWSFLSPGAAPLISITLLEIYPLEDKV